MTIYYQKAADKLQESIYDVNPARYSGILPTMGQLPTSVKPEDAWNEGLVVHYNALEKVTNAAFGKVPNYADGSAKPHPAVTLPFWASWSYTVTENQMKQMDANPNGNLAQIVGKALIAQQGAYINKVDRFVANYLPTANPITNLDYMSDWQGTMDVQATVGTVQAPEDVNEAVGILTATGVKITGAGQAVDSVTQGFDRIRDGFASHVDTTSFQRLTHGDGSDNYALYINPEVLSKIDKKFLSNASGEKDYTKTVGEVLRANYEVVPTYAFDPSYNGLSTVVAEYGMALNPRENLVWESIVDYGVSDWEYFQNKDQPMQGTYRIWGGQRFIAYPVAHKINNLWMKAVQHFSNIPYNA